MAAYEVLLLNTAVPQIQAAQSGDTYVVPRDIAFNAGFNIVNNDATIYGVTVGRGAGAVAQNTAVGASALAANTSGAYNVAVGANAALNATSFANATVVGMNAIGTGIATGTYITAIGTSSLQKLTSGSYITGVGVLALKENTTGSYNTALGVEALQANDTASYNTAVGYQAGYSNTTGQYNVALGYAALYSSTTSDQNTALGYETLRSNTTGAYNSVSGFRALYSNTTGNSNTAQGFDALRSNTTASNSTAVGYQSLYTNNATVSAGSFVTGTSYVIRFVGTTDFTLIGAANNNIGTVFTATGAGTGTGTAIANGGVSNTALGFQALYSNTTASYNTAVGYQAGYSNTTGNGTNSYFGYQAGYGVTTGAVNTFIGYGAGASVTTGSKNTILGAYNGNQGSLDIRTASNYVVLSDGDGNPRQVINGSGNVGIGTVSPSNKLVVSNAGAAGLEFVPGETNGPTIYSYNRSTSAWATLQTFASQQIFCTNGTTERARITSGGYFKASDTGTYFGSTSAYHEFYQTNNSDTIRVTNTSGAVAGAYGIYVDLTTDPNATDSFFLRCYGGANQRASIRSNGGLANYQSNDVDLSDIRTKTDINPVASYWSKIAALEIVSYKYKDQTHDDLNIGVIAQQVEQVAPEFVDVDGFGDTPEDGVPLKTIYNKDLTFAAIKALQEAMARIETLEAEVAALKGN